MLKFLVRLFALVGFIAVMGVVALVGLAAHTQEKALVEPPSVILSLDFDNPIVEQSDTSPFDVAMSDDTPTSLPDILHALDLAKDDPHVKGVVARFGGSQPSIVQAQEIRAALARFRGAGKFTYAFGTDFGEFGTGNKAYYLASAFENIWLQPVGTVSLTTLALEDFFAKSALDKIGVSADFMQREEYKDFMERAQRDGFSPPVKVELQALLENLGDQLASGIAQSRKMDIAKVKDLMMQGPYTAEEARQAGLVTRIAYADELDDELDKIAGKDAKQVDTDTYLGYSNVKKMSDKDGTKIAMIYGSGLITDKSSSGGDIASDHVMGADEIAGAFDDAADDKHIKAILFRIDSPGGSPAASETIRRALIHAQKKGKPVIVSMGDTAASGGYWIAMNGDHIVADPGTLTGSIGVLAGKFVIDGLIQKLGISVDGVKTGENGGMWSPTAPFSPSQRARVNAMLDDTYHSFVNNVSSARRIPMEKMPDIAKGRVWTGDQAVHIGLVDELGGYDVALGAVRKALKLDDKATLTLVDFPVPPSPLERLSKLMRKMSAESSALNVTALTLAHMQSLLRPYLGMAAAGQSPVRAHMQMELIHD